MIKDVIRFYVLERCLPNFTQFVEGFTTLNVYDNIKKYPEYFIELFCKTAETVLILSRIKKVFTIIHSEQGSNKTNAESRIIAFWEDYLIECDENEGEDNICTLEEILIFSIAVNIIATIGFSVQPTIKF